MKKLILILACFILNVFAADEVIHIATVDSGFGGFFTAKAIEKEALELSKHYQVTFDIRHYGDTKNAPYGEKTPDEIAGFASSAIQKAYADGNEKVFLACNTASSQFSKIKTLLENPSTPVKISEVENTYSIINSSVAYLKDKIEKDFSKKKLIRLAILATPATMKADAYPREIQKALGFKEILPSQMHLSTEKRWYQKKGTEIQSGWSFLSRPISKKRTLEIYQFAPGNWVDMIEHQATEAEAQNMISENLNLLTREVSKNKTFDVVAEFCTHFPVFEDKFKAVLTNLKLSGNKTYYLQQGALFASIFKKQMLEHLHNKARLKPLSEQELSEMTSKLSPKVFISGTNKTETETLIKTIFPDEQNPSVSAF